jgi:hypothetical protein
MTSTGRQGWLFSLRDDQKFDGRQSNWGGILSFYADMAKVLNSADARNETPIVSSVVWGRILSDFKPEKGDGFAFYHSYGALFPRKDEFGRKPRISAIGEVVDIRLDGRKLNRIKVAIDRQTLRLLRKTPIVRSDSTRHLFEQCGIVQGPVATLYRAPPSIWNKLTSMVREMKKKTNGTRRFVKCAPKDLAL